MNPRLTIVALAALLAACGAERDSRAEPAPADIGANRPAAAPQREPVEAPAPDAIPQPRLGEAIALAEWRKADNRGDCAPLAFASDGGGVAIDAKPRRAQFSGGWAVAFDLPNLRSAFGIAGPGLLPEDRNDFAVQVDALAKQWPYIRRWGAGENLPTGSAAGYGVIGAQPYPKTNQAGFRLHSLAYLRVPGQRCQYNVWSRISRVHLETMLGLVHLIDPDEGAR